MKVMLAGGDPETESAGVASIRRLAHADRVGRHTVVEDPDAADLVLLCDSHLFDDWNMRRMRAHPLTRHHGDKTYIYCERDDPFCVLPGLYVSMPGRDFDPRFQVACPYQRTEDPRDPGPSDAASEPDLLFSFIGGRTHRCRDPLFDLRDPEAVVEFPAGFVFYDPSSTDFAARRNHFVATVRRSRFVLCPRGQGTSSIRLYETLAAGRVPVIIADDWVPPSGIDWPAVSIRWPEGVTTGLADHLRSRADEAAAMGRSGRRAYETVLAEEVAFDSLVQRLEPLVASGAAGRFRRRLVDRRHLAVAWHAASGRARGRLGAVRRTLPTLR
jgi:hypothetical protein